MIERTIYNKISAWLRNGKNALMLTGARQTGKTFLIRECLKQSGLQYIEINFIEHPEFIPLFEEGGVEDILMRISVATDRKLIPGSTVIFLDEVQEQPEIITQIKFLVDEGSYRYILSGSLLGVELFNVRSIPVGYMTIVDMFPVTLREYYSAIGLKSDIFDHIRECFEKRVPVDSFIHERLMKSFFLYLITGGMPEALSVYLETKNIQKVSEVHEQIIRLYEADFTKYEKKHNLKLKEIYNAIPGELNEKNKRFFINHLGKGEAYDKFSDDFLWLKNAGVALPAYNVTEPTVPLIISEKRNLFKLFYSDVGLLTSSYTAETKRRILMNDAYVNNGALFENIVAQELAAHGYKLYYYNNKKRGELDFVIEHEGKVLPIEVKSGKDYKRHSALENVLNTPNYDIDTAYIFCCDNLSVEGSRVYLPIYMLMFLEERTMDIVYPMDLSDLSIG